MTVNVTPLHDRVLVRRLEEKKKPRRAGSSSLTPPAEKPLKRVK